MLYKSLCSCSDDSTAVDAAKPVETLPPGESKESTKATGPIGERQSPDGQEEPKTDSKTSPKTGGITIVDVK